MTPHDFSIHACWLAALLCALGAGRLLARHEYARGVRDAMRHAPSLLVLWHHLGLDTERLQFPLPVRRPEERQ